MTHTALFSRRALAPGRVLSFFLMLSSVAGQPPSPPPVTATLLASGLAGASGTAIGPGGALFVAEGAAGRISRIDPATGQVTIFASGLPKQLIPIGGPIDLAFIGGTAYVLVTLVGPEFGGTSVSGIYRVDGPDKFTVIADIGAWAVANPPTTPFDGPSGVQYAIDTYHGGFVVTDGHHNRVLFVTLDGKITSLLQFVNVAPTGLATSGNTIYVAEAGPVPHLPSDGKIVAFEPGASAATPIASGASLMVDVEFGRGRELFALSQGTWDGPFPGAPSLPDSGALHRVNGDGTLTLVRGNLDRPVSMEIIGNTAYVVTLLGQVWKVDNIAGPPHGTN